MLIDTTLVDIIIFICYVLTKKNMLPYVYKLTSKNNEYYYGVRWAYSGNPEDDILINYFTSSSLVKELISKNGITYFYAEIVNIFESKNDALDYEYKLIKSSINDKNCLNKAMGKCTIWDENLKKQISETIKKKWENVDFRINATIKASGINNHNYNLKPWKNVNSDIESWKKILEIYNDYISEKWDFNKYGFGRLYLQNRYNIVQGTARTFIKLIKNNWNPLLDNEFLTFINNNVGMS